MEMAMELELKVGAETEDGDGNGDTYNMKCSFSLLLLLLLLPHETGRQHEMHFNCMSSNCNVFAHTSVRVGVYMDKDALPAF